MALGGAKYAGCDAGASQVLGGDQRSPRFFLGEEKSLLSWPC